MKILHLSLDTRLEEYNAQYIHTLSLVKYYSRLGNEVFLVIGGDENKIINKTNYKMLITRFDPSAYGSNLFLKLFKLVYKNLNLLLQIIKNVTLKEYDVIYERHNLAISVGLILSKIYRIPIFYEVNGIPDEEFSDKNNIQARFLRNIILKICKTHFKNSKGIIVPTKELKEIIQKRIHPNNIFVVENGVDILKSSPIKRGNHTELTFVGGLSRYRKLDKVFASMSRIKEKFRFTIVGGGEFKEKYIKKYAYDKRFLFVGELPHKQTLNYIVNSNICIASYNLQFPLFRKYGFYFCPLKLLEYSAAGKPTLMYGLSNSFTKIFEKGNACTVVNSNEKFIKKLRFLIRNKKLIEKMGRNARQISNKFTWEKAAKKTERILKYAIETN